MDSKPIRWSLVDRLTLGYTVSTFALITMVVVALYWSLARTLSTDDNLFISDKVQTIRALLSSDPQSRSIKDRVEKEWVSRKFERCYIKILGSDGRTIAETPNSTDIPKDLFANSGNGLKTREAPNGKVFKAAVIRVFTAEDPAHEKTIQIALDRTSEEGLLDAFRSRFLLMLALALVIMMLINRRIAIKGMMLDRLNESFERLSRFSQDIAHDLRTPLNNLQGELEVALSRRRAPEEYEDVLGSCLEECGRLTHLINNLLFLARAENPTSGLAIERLDLKKEILRITDFFEASATESGLTLQVDVPDGLAIEADRALLQRAVGNLISNAVNYTKKGGTVVVSAKLDDRSTQIKVADNGVGIAREHLHRVFDRFYRVEESRSAQSGGTGLGLSIVKGIMALHKGGVGLESELGRGTAVTLTFPLA